MTPPLGRAPGPIRPRLGFFVWALGLAVQLVCVSPAVVQAQRPPPPATERAEILERLGVASLQRRDYEQAARYFRAAIAAGRDHWQIRQNLGFALLSLDRCEEAVGELELSARQSPAPRSFVYLARCYERLKKPGVAIHWLQLALLRLQELAPAEQKDVLGSLGYLYSAEGQHAAAAEAWERALALGDDPEIALRLGRAQRLLGDARRARQTLMAIEPERLSRASRAVRLDELAALDRAEGQLTDSIAALEEANALEPSAQRHHALGLAFGDLKRRPEAVDHLERAHALAPDDLGYAVALGYAYKDAGRLADAARVFEGVVARDPDRLPLYQELGYIYAALSDTSRAVEWFKKAIDNAPRDPRPESDIAEERARLQQEVARLAKRFEATAYLTYRSSQRQPSTGSGGAVGGTLPSQSGVEVAYQPPVIGFRDERIFQVFARLLWNFRPESLDVDDHSLQAGVGLRYKPLRTQNLFVSAERLFAIGRDASDDWLLRALYSWEHHPLLGKPDWSHWNYTTVFADVGYFVERSLWVLYGEARQGVTFRIANQVLLTPHVVVDARYQDARGPTDSFVEGGGGVSLRYLFGESRYEGYRGSVELLIQYKAGDFFNRQRGASDGSFHGLVLTGVLRF